MFIYAFIHYISLYFKKIPTRFQRYNYLYFPDSEQLKCNIMNDGDVYYAMGMLEEIAYVKCEVG